MVFYAHSFWHFWRSHNYGKGKPNKNLLPVVKFKSLVKYLPRKRVSGIYGSPINADDIYLLCRAETLFQNTAGVDARFTEDFKVQANSCTNTSKQLIFEIFYKIYTG